MAMAGIRGAQVLSVLASLGALQACYESHELSRFDGSDGAVVSSDATPMDHDLDEGGGIGDLCPETRNEIRISSPSECSYVDVVSTPYECDLPTRAGPQEVTSVRILSEAAVVGPHRVFWQYLGPAECLSSTGLDECRLWFYKARSEFPGGACGCSGAGLDPTDELCAEAPCVVSYDTPDADRYVNVQFWGERQRIRMWACGPLAPPPEI